MKRRKTMKSKGLTIRLMLVLVLALLLALPGTVGAQDPGPNDPPPPEAAAAEEPEQEEPFGSGDAAPPEPPPAGVEEATPVNQVDPATLTCSDVIDFDGLSEGSYDAVIDLEGASFAERFAGQSLTYSGNFDVLSAVPSDPLTLQVGEASKNIHILHGSYPSVVDGLGPLGFPHMDAIGEGAIAALFDIGQFEVGFQIVGANAGGSVTVNFFRSDGSLIHTSVFQSADGVFAFRRSGNVRDIAGMSIHNDDPWGIGYDNFVMCLAQPGVEPKTVSSDLQFPGDVLTIDKTVTTPPIPPKPDVYFLADSTGSMGGAIANVKTNASTILTTVAAQTTDPQFGAGNYKDFPYDAYAFSNDASIGDAAPALLAINAWSHSGGYDGSEAQLYALDQIAAGVPGWRSGSTRIVVWFGDWPGHDPVCQAISGLSYDITEASATSDLVAAGIQVIAISVTTNYPWADPGCTLCDLDGNPTLNANDYSGTCTIGGMAGQAGRIATATDGVHFSNVPPGDVSDAILAGLQNLPATVTPQLDPACSNELDYAFSPASQTVTSGDAASFVETVTVKAGASGGLKTCTVDWLINGVSAGPDFEQTISIYVNEPPVADPNGPYLGAAGSPIAFDGTGSYDPDGDSLTYAWDFGDSSSGTGDTPSHTYAEAGIYDVCLTVNDGYVDSEEVCTIAVVYDPDGGFVTGGGWIDSPAGAYKPDTSLSGKANFGFVSKYKKGATTPTGNTEFQFHAADLNFHSTSYDWLVVTGSNYARFKGVGTINGEGEYKFMLWAGDGTGAEGADTFRIRIWTEEEVTAVETDVYDNGSDQAIGGGSIVVHTKKK
jgi:hypothetical protein